MMDVLSPGLTMNKCVMDRWARPTKESSSTLKLVRSDAESVPSEKRWTNFALEKVSHIALRVPIHPCVSSGHSTERHRIRQWETCL